MKNKVRSVLMGFVMMPFLYSGVAMASDEMTVSNDQLTTATTQATIASTDLQTERWGRPRLCWRRGRFGRPRLVPCDRWGRWDVSQNENAAVTTVAANDSTDLQVARRGDDDRGDFDRGRDRWHRPRLCWRRGPFGRVHLVPCDRRGRWDVSQNESAVKNVVTVADNSDLQTEH